jgi:hypothetical protein
MVVLPRGDVLHELAPLESRLGVLVESGLEPPAHTVDDPAAALRPPRLLFRGIHARHHHALRGRVHHPFHKVRDLCRQEQRISISLRDLLEGALLRSTGICCEDVFAWWKQNYRVAVAGKTVARGEEET